MRRPSAVGVAIKTRPPAGEFDAIVIGSGIGGLCAAAALAKTAGQRVIVLEQHSVIGGYTHTFSRRGYEWDVGVHYVGDVGEGGRLRGLFDSLSERRLQWASLPDVYDRIIIGEKTYDFARTPRAFVQHLVRAFPSEERVLQRYVELIQGTTERSQQAWLSQSPKPSTPTLPKFAVNGLRHRSTREVLKALTSNETLISVLTGQYGNYGLPPARSAFEFHAAAAAHYLDGAFYPVGGGAALARELAPTIEAPGGMLCTRAAVSEVLIEHGQAVGVRLVTGQELHAKTIISNAGAKNTFGQLLDVKHVPRRYLALLETYETSLPAVCLYVGFRQPDEALGLTGTNVWSYEDADHDVEHIDEESSRIRGAFFSFSSAKDPSFQTRHPGRATMELVAITRWSMFHQWADTLWQRRGPAYLALKQRLTQSLLGLTYRRFPQLEGRVDHVELSTPLSAAHFTRHAQGEMYGRAASAHRLEHPLSAETEIPGLYLAGADIVCAGVAGAALSGVLAAGAAAGRSLMLNLFKPIQQPLEPRQ